MTTDRQHLDAEQTYAWLRGAYWSSGLRRDVFDTAIANSHCFIAVADRRQIGFARVVSDAATFAWLCDVFVDPDWRARGVARALVTTILADARYQTVRRFCLATRDAHGVYTPLGFASVPNGVWMEWQPPRSRWRDEP